MINKDFLLHLTLIDDIGPAVIKKMMQFQRSDVQTSDLYHLSALQWMQYFRISELTAQKLVTGLSDISVLEKELELIEKNRIQLVTIIDQSYPYLLKEIHLPPVVLYFYGAEFEKCTKSLAVVGSRKANHYGQKIINAVIPDLIAAGYTIVSGGAVGIDTMAHQAALECGGKTIVILGSGLLRPYPGVNKKMFYKIIESGGIVASSYPLLMEPFPGNFPARNRIVTGLSQGCLVVQAAQKSGALISAHCALEQGREVFAVPGLFDDELSAGCNEIIQQGAKLVMNSADILTEFGDRVVISAKPIIEQKSFQQPITFSAAQPSNYSDTQQKIVAVCTQPASLEDITSITQLSFEQVQSELFTLQLDGVVSQDFSGMWSISSLCNRII
jgi:DNA processing protein